MGHSSPSGRGAAQRVPAAWGCPSLRSSQHGLAGHPPGPQTYPRPQHTSGAHSPPNPITAFPGLCCIWILDTNRGTHTLLGPRSLPRPSPGAGLKVLAGLSALGVLGPDAHATEPYAPKAHCPPGPGGLCLVTCAPEIVESFLTSWSLTPLVPSPPRPVSPQGEMGPVGEARPGGGRRVVQSAAGSRGGGREGAPRRSRTRHPPKWPSLSRSLSRLSQRSPRVGTSLGVTVASAGGGGICARVFLSLNFQRSSCPSGGSLPARPPAPESRGHWPARDAGPWPRLGGLSPGAGGRWRCSGLRRGPWQLGARGRWAGHGVLGCTPGRSSRPPQGRWPRCW